MSEDITPGYKWKGNLQKPIDTLTTNTLHSFLSKEIYIY